ncbi:hypothetical protein D3C85_1376120 [compost metagenome]
MVGVLPEAAIDANYGCLFRALIRVASQLRASGIKVSALAETIMEKIGLVTARIPLYLKAQL